MKERPGETNRPCFKVLIRVDSEDTFGVSCNINNKLELAFIGGHIYVGVLFWFIITPALYFCTWSSVSRSTLALDQICPKYDQLCLFSVHSKFTFVKQAFGILESCNLLWIISFFLPYISSKNKTYTQINNCYDGILMEFAFCF